MRRTPSRTERRASAWPLLFAAGAALALASAATGAADQAGGARDAGAATAEQTNGAAPSPAPTQRAQRTQRMVDPAGLFLPVKPKVFKDLESIEISDYDRARARNTGELYALVHLKKDVPSALEPVSFRLIGLQIEFTARTSAGVIYRFRGKFTRGGYLDTMGKSGDVILQGHLEAYLGQELLRQEQLDFKYRRVVE
jgi:hypothetical protein